VFDFFGGLIDTFGGHVREACPIMDLTEYHPFGVVPPSFLSTGRRSTP
jgi:hypothetical protein